MLSKFLEHPKDVDETYFEHFKVASGFGIKMLKLAFVCFSHALFPWTFEHKASDDIIDMADCMEERQELAECED